MFSALSVLMKRLTTPIDSSGGSGRLHLVKRNTPKHITPDVAMSLSTVWACANFIAGGIAQLPCRVMKNDANDNAQNNEKHSAYWLLYMRPSAEMSAFDFVFHNIWDAVIYGNGYAEIEMTPIGQPYALHYLEPGRVEADRDINGNLLYRVQQKVGSIVLEPSRMFHVHGVGYDGVTGYGVVQHAARSLSVAVSSEEYGAGFFANSGIPSAVIQHPKTMGDTAFTRLSKQIASILKRGPAQSQDVLVLEEGSEFKLIGLPPEQAQFLGTRNHSVTDICRWFGVPPSKVGHFEKISYNSAEQLSLDVASECFMPWIKRFEQEVNYKLLKNCHGGNFAQFDMRASMRSTHAERAEYYRKLFMTGAISINDIRRKENLPTIEDGDLHFIPINMAPLGFISDGKYLPQPKATATDAPANDDEDDKEEADEEETDDQNDDSERQPSRSSGRLGRPDVALLSALHETVRLIENRGGE